MPTTRSLTPHIISGMDATNPPHLVADDKWIMQRGFRNYDGRVQQFEGFFSLFTNQSEGPAFSIPTGVAHSSILAMVGRSAAKQIRLSTLFPSAVVTLNKLDGTVPTLYSGVGDERTWFRTVGTVYHNQVWVTSPVTPLYFTDGTYVGTFSTQVPSGRYIENFFDHLVVANSTFKGRFEPWTIRWSDLYNFGVWEPTEENEADFIELSAWQRPSSFYSGATGLGKIGDFLYIYTDSCIFRCRYVGLPKVMIVEPVSGCQGIGNSLFNGLVTSKDLHFFFDRYTEDFYVFDGSSPKSIGKPIKRMFVNLSLFTQSILGPAVESFAIEDRNEAWWVTTVVGSPTLAFVYNWGVNEWSVYTVPPNLSWHLKGGGRTVVPIDSRVGTIDSIPETCDEVGDGQSYIPSRLFGASVPLNTGDVYQEGTSVQENPFLESKDYIGNAQEVGEADQVCIHADYAAGDGIDVLVSARMSIQEPVVYKKVGTWKKTTPEGIISFTPIKSRIFRYKFEMTGSPPQGYVFYGFVANHFSVRAER